MAASAVNERKDRVPMMTTAYRVLMIAMLWSAALPAAAQETLQPIEGETAIEPGEQTRLYREVNEWFESVAALRSDFLQIAPDGSVSEGRLYLKRPGRLRFEYSDDTPLLLVSDGDVLSFIDYDIGQVTRWPIKETALGILVDENFSLDRSNAMISSLALEDGRRVALVSVTDSDNPERGNLTLAFEDKGEQGLALMGWEVVDGQGGVTRINLENTEKNVTLAGDLWTFKDPRSLPSERRRRSR